MIPKILFTERLILRRATENDFEHLFLNYFSDPTSSLFLTRKPHAHRDQTKQFLKDWCQTPWDICSDRFAWVIALANSGLGIGVFLVELGDIRSAQIHYGICPDSSRQGLTTEAGHAVIQWLINHENIHRIWTACDTANQGSIRVLEKLGFHNEGVRKHWLNLPAFSGTSRDCYVYALEKSNPT